MPTLMEVRPERMFFLVAPKRTLSESLFPASSKGIARERSSKWVFLMVEWHIFRVLKWVRTHCVIHGGVQRNTLVNTLRTIKFVSPTLLKTPGIHILVRSVNLHW